MIMNVRVHIALYSQAQACAIYSYNSTIVEITYYLLINSDSRVKSQSAFSRSYFKLREKGIKNTYDAGVNSKLRSLIWPEV